MDRSTREQTAIGPNAALTDAEAVVRILAGERGLFEVADAPAQSAGLPRGALHPAGRLGGRGHDAGGVCLRLPLHLGQFNGHSAFSTWLTRIAINAALMRRRGTGKLVLLDNDLLDGASPMPFSQPLQDAERRAASREATALLEIAVDSLPELYRSVFMLREIEELDTSETAGVLGVSEEVVKTRLHRAKASLRERFLELAGEGAADAFGFEAPRCNRVSDAVMDRILRMP